MYKLVLRDIMASHKIIGIRRNKDGLITHIITPSEKRGKALQWEISEVINELINGTEFIVSQDLNKKVVLKPYIRTEDNGSISELLLAKFQPPSE